MELIGYARTYTTDEDSDILIASLKAASCTTLFIERENEQTAFKECMTYLRKDDVLIVTRIEQIAQSISGLRNTLIELGKRRVRLKAIEQPFDTGGAGGKEFLEMLSVFYEFETSIRSKRHINALAKAKSNGVRCGRKPSIDAAEVRRLRIDEKMGATEIARYLKIGRSTVYKILNQSAVTFDKESGE
ncbi:MAG: recombinase family protein [Gammaproteobacteria bacterium]|nr:recombinase family protein [Gammaproteobacteria bacterium]